MRLFLMYTGGEDFVLADAPVRAFVADAIGRSERLGRSGSGAGSGGILRAHPRTALCGSRHLASPRVRVPVPRGNAMTETNSPRGGLPAGGGAAPDDAAPSRIDALAFATDEVSETALRDGLAHLGDAQVWSGGIGAATAALGQGHSATLVFVDLDAVAYPAGALHELAAVCEEGTAVVAFGAEASAARCREVLLAGVSEYLVKPLGAEAVREAAMLAGTAQPPPQGRLVGFTGTGGSGATTLAALIALGRPPRAATTSRCSTSTAHAPRSRSRSTSSPRQDSPTSSARRHALRSIRRWWTGWARRARRASSSMPIRGARARRHPPPRRRRYTRSQWSFSAARISSSWTGWTNPALAPGAARVRGHARVRGRADSERCGSSGQDARASRSDARCALAARARSEPHPGVRAEGREPAPSHGRGCGCGPT